MRQISCCLCSSFIGDPPYHSSSQVNPTQITVFKLYFCALLVFVYQLVGCHHQFPLTTCSNPYTINTKTNINTNTDFIMSKKSIISCVNELGFPFKTLDPFLFCVYHKDAYPAGDEKMQTPRRGNGADFNPNSPYR